MIKINEVKHFLLTSAHQSIFKQNTFQTVLIKIQLNKHYQPCFASGWSG